VIFEQELGAVFDFLILSEKMHHDIDKDTHSDDEQGIEELIQQQQLVPIMALTYGVSIYEYYLTSRFQMILSEIIIDRGPWGTAARKGEEPSTVDSAITNIVEQYREKSGRKYWSLKDAYLQVLGLKFSDSGITEKRISEIREVRNSNVHRSGEATGRLSKIIGTSYKKGTQGEVWIDLDYVRKALHDLRRIVEHVDETTDRMFDGLS
jgi:hypothetical protein